MRGGANFDARGGFLFRRLKVEIIGTDPKIWDQYDEDDEILIRSEIKSFPISIMFPQMIKNIDLIG